MRNSKKLTRSSMGRILEKLRQHCDQENVQLEQRIHQIYDEGQNEEEKNRPIEQKLCAMIATWLLDSQQPETQMIYGTNLDSIVQQISDLKFA